LEKDIKNFIYLIRFPLLFTLILWIVTILDIGFGLKLMFFGIYPREFSGLQGVIFSPLIHSGWSHLIANSSPILVLTSIITLFYARAAGSVLVMIWIGMGMMVWMFARPSYHIGASGLVYGLVFYIFFAGIFKKNLKSIVLALIVLTVYSGMFTSMFPNVKDGISWESHLYGALVGLVTAFIFKNVVEEDEVEKDSPWANDDHSLVSFFAADTFDKTKMQRKQEEEAIQLALYEAEMRRLEAERFQRQLDAFRYYNNSTYPLD